MGPMSTGRPAGRFCIPHRRLTSRSFRNIDSCIHWKRDLNPWGVELHLDDSGETGIPGTGKCSVPGQEDGVYGRDAGLDAIPALRIEGREKRSSTTCWSTSSPAARQPRFRPSSKRRWSRHGVAVSYSRRRPSSPGFGATDGGPGHVSDLRLQPAPMGVGDRSHRRIQLARHHLLPGHVLDSQPEEPCRARRFRAGRGPAATSPMDFAGTLRAKLAPGVMNRFDVRLARVAKRPACRTKERDGVIRVRGKNTDWALNVRSGLVEHLRFDGKDVLNEGAFKAQLVMADQSNPWA